MTIKDRLRRIAKSEGMELLLDDAIDSLRMQGIEDKEYNHQAYAAMLTWEYERKKDEYRQYITS